MKIYMMRFPIIRINHAVLVEMGLYPNDIVNYVVIIKIVFGGNENYD